MPFAAYKIKGQPHTSANSQRYTDIINEKSALLQTITINEVFPCCFKTFKYLQYNKQ